MKRSVTLAISIILCFACDKNDSDTNQGGTLDKWIVNSPGDSSLTQFTYDGNGKLSGHYTYESTGQRRVLKKLYSRNNAGRIIKKSAQSNNDPVLETFISYQPGSSQLKSAVSFYNNLLLDSSVYVYSNGNLTVHNYLYQPANSSYIYFSRTDYTVQNANITRWKNYSMTEPVDSFRMDVQFTYDSNTAPLGQTVEEAILTYMSERFFVTNNVTRMDLIYPTPPSEHFTTSITYTYTVTGQPLTANILWMPSGKRGIIEYVYK